jgi:tetratricopeptide (TPR) repeat protein
VNWGLLSPDHDSPRFLRLQPIFPYFLRNRLYAPEQREVRSAVETAFREHYDQLGGMLIQLLNSKKPEERQVGQIVIALEYENLVTALNLALEAQISIQGPYFALSSYLDLQQDQSRGLELGQAVLSRLEKYPLDKLAGSLGYEFSSVIDDIALRQLNLKQYAIAEASYQKVLSLLFNNQQLDANTIKKQSASVYHQLGRVAEEQRQWEQAEQHYQRALQIYIEFNDRYAQAGTYHQLGRVAQEQRQWEQAEQYYLRSLEIVSTFDDPFHQRMVLQSLAHLWKASDANDLPAAVASILDYSVEETKKLLREILDEE